MKRFRVMRTSDDKYPLGIWDNERKEWRGHYYQTSASTARAHCSVLNKKHREGEKEPEDRDA